MWFEEEVRGMRRSGKLEITEISDESMRVYGLR
jgi:hypothetical protein